MELPAPRPRSTHLSEPGFASSSINETQLSAKPQLMCVSSSSSPTNYVDAEDGANVVDCIEVIDSVGSGGANNGDSSSSASSITNGVNGANSKMSTANPVRTTKASRLRAAALGKCLEISTIFLQYFRTFLNKFSKGSRMF